MLGHKVDPLEYGKFHKTDEGKALIQKEASKLRPVLNIRTGKGRADTDKSSRLIAAEEVLKSMFPDIWGRYEIKVRTMTVEEALDWIRNEMKERAKPGNNVELPPTKRWSNHEYDYIKTPLESDDYDQALADGYEEFSTNGNSLHVLRRKKD